LIWRTRSAATATAHCPLAE